MNKKSTEKNTIKQLKDELKKAKQQLAKLGKDKAKLDNQLKTSKTEIAELRKERKKKEETKVVLTQEQRRLFSALLKDIASRPCYRPRGQVLYQG